MTGVKIAGPNAKKLVVKRLKNAAARADGRWRLDFSMKRNSADKPRTLEQRRAATKAWLKKNYPHVLRNQESETK